MKLTYLHQSLLLGLATAERESEILDQLDQEALEDNRQDELIDLRVVNIKARREISKDLNEFWSGDARLEDFSEYPKLLRYLKTSLTPLRDRVLEKNLPEPELFLISMDTIEVIFTF